MNTLSLNTLGLLCAALLLAACGGKKTPEPSPELRRQVAATQTALRQQAADFDRQSRDLQRQLADLEKALLEKETSGLKERIEAMRSETERLQAAADEARQRGEELAASLARAPATLPPATPGQTLPGSPSLETFRRDLAPYGQWLDTGDYGGVWRPAAAADLSWRPYVDGSWSWSDAGWTWSSNEPFGRVCYHYGRWTQVPRHGWIWVPGTEWAPAWVSWRSGKDCVGWAPLPPAGKRRTRAIGQDCDAELRISAGAYCFIPTRHFVRRSYTTCLLSPAQVASVFRQTTNTTQLVPSQQADRVIHTQRGGPDRDRIEADCRLPVPGRPTVTPALPGNLLAVTPARDLRTPPAREGALTSTVTETTLPINRRPETDSVPQIAWQPSATARPRTLEPAPEPPLPASPAPEIRPQPVPSRTLSNTSTTGRSPNPLHRDDAPPAVVLGPEPRVATLPEAATPSVSPQAPDEAAAQREAQAAAMFAEQERQQQVAAMEAEQQRQAQEAAMRAEQERQQQLAAMEAERQQAAMRAEEERQQQLAMEAERERQAQEAAMRAEQERQQQMAAIEAERQREAQEAAMRAEQERQQQMAAMEAERQRQAQEAAMRAEQERQQQMAAMEAERQRQAQEAAMRAEQQRQQQMAMEAERQRLAEEAASRLAQERQQQAAMEAERQRQIENRPPGE